MKDVRFYSFNSFFFLRVVFDIFNIIFHFCYLRFKFWGSFFFFFFFNCYLAAPRPTSGHYRGDSLTHPMLITAFLHIRPEGHREPRSEVGSLSPAERLGFFHQKYCSDSTSLFPGRFIMTDCAVSPGSLF